MTQGNETQLGPARLNYLVSHPIQYQAPLLRRLAGCPEIDLKVFFLHASPEGGSYDEGFGREVEWDIDVISGYQWEVLPGRICTRKSSRMYPLTYGLRSRLFRPGSEMLWVHGHAHHANLRAIQMASRLRVPILYRAETSLEFARGFRLANGVKDRFKRGILRKVSAFLTIGTRNREYYEALGVERDRLFCVPYVVDNDFFQARVEMARARRPRLRASLGLEAGRPVIMFASKLQGRKRAHDLLRAYARLSRDGVSEPFPYLLFVGEGEDEPGLRAAAQSLGWDSVRFLGFRNQTELPALYDLCDVFVLPSIREPWGLVINEVMNAGKPVVVTDEVGCVPDLVADGENGYVIKAGDTEMLSARLRLLTESASLRGSMGKASLDRIQEWNLDKAVAGVLEAVEAVRCGVDGETG